MKVVGGWVLGLGLEIELGLGLRFGVSIRVRGSGQQRLPTFAILVSSHALMRMRLSAPSSGSITGGL